MSPTDNGESAAVLSSVKKDLTASQVELARRMAERQMAMQVATVRELMVWFVPFLVSSYGFLYYGYRKTKSWVVMFPLIPITFGFGYQVHFAYGNKTNQIKSLAERIMKKETHMMAVPEWSTTFPSHQPPHQEGTQNKEQDTTS
ncbi:Plasminogen receptor (KT) [Chionoecetes opilio]|uniref:Plasminogen receptor (KT) n=1 Tax=Chionoecetes opilio TaxID=41210 RepID=A0A8J4Y4J2_CHIOP|nr:Plasminogen receptor (KT) [Chionoecetes opilio]